jgi:hypothetical protein
MDANWVEKVGEAVMAFSALASLVNHAVRKKQEAGEAIAGWLLQLNALLNVGALNLDVAVQQFKAAKASGSKINVVEILQSLVKGKSPALEALLKKAAEVEAKAEETHVVGITAGEPLMAVVEPITLVKEEASDAEKEAKQGLLRLNQGSEGRSLEVVADKVELTVREPELEQKVTQEDVSASAAAGVVDFVHNEEEEQLPPPPAEIVVPELADDTIAYVTEPPKKRVLKTAAAKAKATAKKSAPKKSDKAKK